MSDEIPGASPRDLPRRIEARRGFSVSYRGRTLLSLVDPAAQGERLAEKVRISGRTLYFCPSPLYGYGLCLLLEKMEKAAVSSALVCVELDDKLLDLSLRYMDRSVLAHPRFRLTGTGSAAGLCSLVRSAWGPRTFRRVEILRFSAGWRLFPERYDELAAALDREIALDWGNAMTLVKLGRRYIRNALRNLSLIPGAVSVSDLSFGSAPVLVLGAGPSLDGVLQGLADNFGPRLADRDRRPFRIVCVDTCLAPLAARNIRPDLVVALESQHWNLRDFVGAGDRETALAMDLSALPATAETLGKVYLFYTPWTELRIFDRLEEQGLLPCRFLPLGSVGLSAVLIALEISRGPVITAGIDFSFTLDSYHARAAAEHGERLGRQNRFRGILNAEAAFRRNSFPVFSKSGTAVRSDPSMRNYRYLFEREFASRDRLRDTEGTGLFLGIPVLAPEALYDALAGPPAEKDPPVTEACLPAGGSSLRAAEDVPADPGAEESPPSGRIAAERAARLGAFISTERETILHLRRILTGERTAAADELEGILDRCDYLWAHFPDCAGAEGRRPSGTDISFLKRVRAEIDPFVKLFDLVSKELETNYGNPPFCGS
ncbi:MAG: DUF115 domain-containing protein [Treponema sp.]|jgi:hypothetical protein|nr:DUF115 domain-containing protein [Treponema sp.]